MNAHGSGKRKVLIVAMLITGIMFPGIATGCEEERDVETCYGRMDMLYSEESYQRSCIRDIRLRC
ncbi:hypothetical protein [Natranaerobius thermophilus]|uniref:hypothetical protein n=1 Tax=Natranaerobius thermophilus TaxID=375929 RepID=UPI002F3FF4AA